MINYVNPVCVLRFFYCTILVTNIDVNFFVIVQFKKHFLPFDEDEIRICFQINLTGLGHSLHMNLITETSKSSCRIAASLAPCEFVTLFYLGEIIGLNKDFPLA